MLQVTVYPFMGGYAVHVTQMKVTDDSRQWATLVQELIQPVVSDDMEWWDVLWCVGELLQQRAVERYHGQAAATQRAQRRGYGG